MFGGGGPVNRDKGIIVICNISTDRNLLISECFCSCICSIYVSDAFDWCIAVVVYVGGDDDNAQVNCGEC